MAPQPPPLGSRAKNAFGQRTGPTLAAEVLEIEELILQNNGPYIEDAVNSFSSSSSPPSHHHLPLTATSVSSPLHLPAITNHQNY